MRLSAPLVAVALLAAGCTGKLGGATLEEPDFEVSPESGGKDTTFKVDAGRLGDKYDVQWDFGDGATASGRRAEHAYGFTNGVMTITMVVTDGDGKQGIATRTVTLGTGNNAKPVATLGASPSWAAVGKDVSLNARSSDLDKDPLTYAWSTRAASGGEATLLPQKDQRTTVKFDQPGKYVVRVAVRDPKGAEATAETTVDVTRTIPESTVQMAWNGTLAAGVAGQGVAEKLWGTPAPDSNVDAARYNYTLKYPATTLVMLTWNDTSTQGAFDLDLELRDASGTAVFKSETRAPAPPFEYNVTEQPPGDYVLVVRAVAGANVQYDLTLYSSLHLTPELVAQVEK